MEQQYRKPRNKSLGLDRWFFEETSLYQVLGRLVVSLDENKNLLVATLPK